MRKQLYLKFWLLAMLFSIVGASPAWAQEYTQLYEAQFTNVANHSYTQNKTFTLNSKSWTASVSQVNGGVFYLGCNSSHSSKGVLNNNTTFSSVVTALCNADATYNSKKTTAHAYAMLFENAYSEVTKVRFEWVGGNNAFQVYLFGDSGSGYVLLSSTNYSTSGQSVSGNVEWTGSATNYTKFAIVARPGATNSTATNKTLRAGAFYIYKNTSVPITSITGMESSASLGVGGTVTLTPTVLPANTTETVVWESDDTDVATVSGGVVTGVAAGSTTIRAKSPSDATIKAECTVTVTDAVPVTGVSLNKSNTTLQVGSNEILTATVAPANATNKVVTWTSSNTSVATVENGVVTAVGVGSATITVTTTDGSFTATCAVTVKEKLTAPVITAPTTVMEEGNVAVTISATDGATIYYTTDGSDPTSSSTLYSGSFNVNVVEDVPVTVKAIAIQDGKFDSDVASKTITLYVQPTNIAVDMNYEWLGSSNGSNLSSEQLPVIKDEDNVTITITDGTSNRPRGDVDYIRVYTGSTIKFEAPTGYNLKEIGFTTGGNDTWNAPTASAGSLSSKTWTGEANEVTFTLSGSCFIASVNITLEKIQPKYAFTFTASPTGGTVAVTKGGDAVTSGDEFKAGTVLNITAIPASNYSFTTWTKDAGAFADATSITTTFTMPASAAEINATFTPDNFTLSFDDYENGTLSVVVNGETATPNGDGEYEIPYTASVSITATPDDGYAFSAWDATLDEYNTTANPLAFTMPAEGVMVGASFVNATTDYDIIVDDAIVGGSVTIGGSKTSSKAGETIVISFSENSGYVFNAWNVTDESDNTVTVNYDEGEDEYSFTMPTSDVVVSASFTQVHTVTYYIGGVAQTPVERLHGATLSLDDPSAIDGMAFAGWSSANSASAPVFVANTTTVTADMTLYAAFTAHAAVNEYQKVTATSEVTDGDYLIVYEKDNIIFDGSLSTLDASSNIQKVTISNETIASNETVDSYRFTISAANGYIKSASGLYIGRSSGSNGMDTDNSGLSNTITINNGNAIIQGSGGYQLRFNSSTGSGNYRFRYYSSSSQQPIQLYKKVSTPAIYTFGETVSVSVTSAGYATYCSDKALDFSHATGLKAYIVTSNGSTTDYTEVTDAPANTGLLLKAAANDYEAYVVGTSTTDVTANKLVGVTSATGIYATTDGKTNFVLSNGTQGVGFYKVKSYNDGNPDFTVKANSAYLSVALVSNARESSFFGLPEDESETTGITMVQGERATTQGYYNLNGQRVSQPNRGLYIVNGKKIVIK